MKLLLIINWHAMEIFILPTPALMTYSFEIYLLFHLVTKVGFVYRQMLPIFHKLTLDCFIY